MATFNKVSGLESLTFTVSMDSLLYVRIVWSQKESSALPMCFVDSIRLLRKNIMPFTSFVEQLWASVELNSIQFLNVGYAGAELQTQILISVLLLNNCVILDNSFSNFFFTMNSLNQIISKVSFSSAMVPFSL